MTICSGVECKGFSISTVLLQLELSCFKEHPCICPGALAHQVLGFLLCPSSILLLR